ncbi:MAG: hypothetical protein U5R48_07860 [Gammaproteobacteria bacterium]|nr:hypothetical protein [Gammaproteobacteria bacterium]
MKVFVPFFEEVLDETRALSGADLVPFSHQYPVLRIARRDDPLPEPGEAQTIPPRRSWATAQER